VLESLGIVAEILYLQNKVREEVLVLVDHLDGKLEVHFCKRLPLFLAED
jgi:hypothetical protein